MGKTVVVTGCYVCHNDFGLIWQGCQMSRLNLVSLNFRMPELPINPETGEPEDAEAPNEV